MINKIVVTNPKGEALELELTNPDKSGFAVAKVEGLGPPTAAINGQEMAGSDGMFYTSARAATKQIIFTLEFRARTKDSIYGEISIEECRQLCYRYFPIKKQITITVYTDFKTLYTTGYVESNEPEIFSSQEYAVISVLCPDPFMYEYGDSKTVFSGVRGIFEFPFSNESLMEPRLEFGEIWLDTTAVLDYNGTVDTGILIDIHAYDECSNIVVGNIETGEIIRINTDRIWTITGRKFGSGDDILISTVKGDRYCKLLRNGAYINIIGALDRDVDWFQLTNGDNVFGFSAEVGENNISVTFTYQNAYMGV